MWQAIHGSPETIKMSLIPSHIKSLKWIDSFFPTPTYCITSKRLLIWFANDQIVMPSTALVKMKFLTGAMFIQTQHQPAKGWLLSYLQTMVLRNLPTLRESLVTSYLLALFNFVLGNSFNKHDEEMFETQPIMASQMRSSCNSWWQTG